MSFPVTADQALQTVCRWYGAMPLLSRELLFCALEARTGDFPELPGTLMGQILQRLWLYPPSLEEQERFLMKAQGLWGNGPFWHECASWAANQESDRTYDVPPTLEHAARSEIEIAALSTLRGLLNRWNQCTGTIAFIAESVSEGDAPPLEDALLPFRLVGGKMHDAQEDFGYEAAVFASGARRKMLSVPSFHFPTMGRTLPPWMRGGSGAPAIWFALLAEQNALAGHPLDVGLAGCLMHWSDGFDDYANPGNLVLRKWNLFRRAKVPTVALPNTMGHAGPNTRECALWPQGEPLGKRMQTLLQALLDRDPDAKELRCIHDSLIDGEGDIELEPAHRTLLEMEAKARLRKDMATRTLVLAYICCCRMGREAEAQEREQRILSLPKSEIDDLPIQLRCAYAISEGTAPRLLAFAATLKKSFGISTIPDLTHNHKDKENSK